MQTKFNIVGTVILAIAGLCSVTSHHYTSVFFYVAGAGLILAAYLSKDKKDKQIEEIHKATTTKAQKEVIPPEEQEKLIALIREICHSKYNLRNKDLYTKFHSILSGYSSRGFEILPGSANIDITDLYVKEIRAFSDILTDTMVEILDSEKLKIDPQPFIELSHEMISQKFAEIETLHCNFVNHYFQTVPEIFSTAMKVSFEKQAEHELNLNISKIASQIELKSTA